MESIVTSDPTPCEMHKEYHDGCEQCNPTGVAKQRAALERIAFLSRSETPASVQCPNCGAWCRLNEHFCSHDAMRAHAESILAQLAAPQRSETPVDGPTLDVTDPTPSQVSNIPAASRLSAPRNAQETE